MICRIAADQFVILLHRHDESSIVELLDSSISQMNNFNKKLQLTSKSESTRHSSNPILMDESKQC